MPDKTNRTLIGVLASRDDPNVNRALSAVFTYLGKRKDKECFERFHFVITGGTYDRVFKGIDKDIRPVESASAKQLHKHCGITVLPSAAKGGVVLLSYLITQRQCSIVWPFFGPLEMHWLRPENLAFMRLCDQWHVKRLMNRGSVLVWCDEEAKEDKYRNLQPLPVKIVCRPGERTQHTHNFRRTIYENPINNSGPRLTWEREMIPIDKMSIALIAHDEMKSRMIEFAIDHEAELAQFKTILATGTTGREVAAATSKRIDKKMVRYHSGPKGGDIEIATEILSGRCDIVIFFIDPLRPHPHIEDIRVVFEACMLHDDVIMITNEMHARSFMSKVVRGKDAIAVYPQT